MSTKLAHERASGANFLAGLHGLTAVEAFANLRMDADAYGWSAATRSRVAKGITSYFAKDKNAQGGVKP